MSDVFHFFEQPDSHSDTKPPFDIDSPWEDEEEISVSSVDFSFACPQGRYQLKEKIGRGGMGVVINAYDRVLRRAVAIKLLLHKFRNQPLAQKQFIDEALLTSCLQHPSIPPIYDRGFALDNRPFFVMKLISGVPLSEKLADSSIRQLDRLSLLKCFEQICQTVSYAHSQGILHLDIKPANILIGDFGEVHLMDWGQAKTWRPIYSTNPPMEIDDFQAGTYDDLFVPLGTGGTPAYMAPEQARGEEVSPASDIFSLGALLCEILIGRAPYRAATQKHLLQEARMGRPFKALGELQSSQCDDQLISLANRCLAKNPADRPAEAQMVAKEIGSYLETALEQAESDRCRFFELTLDMFCIASLEGYFVRLNGNFSRVLGYSEQKLISEPFINFVHPDDRAETLEVMGELNAGKPVIQFCNRYRHEQGHYLVFEWTAQSLPEEGQIFAVARDVTNRQVRNREL